MGFRPGGLRRVQTGQRPGFLGIGRSGCRLGRGTFTTQRFSRQGFRVVRGCPAAAGPALWQAGRRGRYGRAASRFRSRGSLCWGGGVAAQRVGGRGVWGRILGGGGRTGRDRVCRGGGHPGGIRQGGGRIAVVRSGVQRHGFQEGGGPQRRGPPGPCRSGRCRWRGGWRGGRGRHRGQQAQGRRGGQAGGERLGVVAVRVGRGRAGVGAGVGLRGRGRGNGGRGSGAWPGCPLRPQGLFPRGRVREDRDVQEGATGGRCRRGAVRSGRHGSLRRQRHQACRNAPGPARPDRRDRQQDGAAIRQAGGSGRRRGGPGVDGAVLLGDGHLPGVCQAAPPLVENTHFTPFGRSRSGGPQRLVCRNPACASSSVSTETASPFPLKVGPLHLTG
ncbi:hypothetical protein Ddep01_01879 [Deinococcus depolymerans]